MVERNRRPRHLQPAVVDRTAEAVRSGTGDRPIAFPLDGSIPPDSPLVFVVDILDAQ